LNPPTLIDAITNNFSAI